MGTPGLGPTDDAYDGGSMEASGALLVKYGGCCEAGGC